MQACRFVFAHILSGDFYFLCISIIRVFHIAVFSVYKNICDAWVCICVWHWTQQTKDLDKFQWIKSNIECDSEKTASKHKWKTKRKASRSSAVGYMNEVISDGFTQTPQLCCDLDRKWWILPFLNHRMLTLSGIFSRTLFLPQKWCYQNAEKSNNVRRHICTKIPNNQINTRTRRFAI